MKTRIEPADGDHYQRPNHPWTCGLAAEGMPCPPGPGPRGQCPAAVACHPVRDGDRWICNRSSMRGGPCPAGPGPDGACGVHWHCTPVRSLRSRRGLLVGGAAMAAVGALVMSLSASWRNEVLAPGPLTVHHARLLRGEDKTQRCGACHQAGNADMASWAAHSLGTTEFDHTQVDLCLKCHDRTIDPQFALDAHTMSPTALAAVAGDSATGDESLRRRDPHEPLACASCHREHQGADHDLTRIADRTCQACHRTQIESFATDHPEFTSWPRAKSAAVAFDHGSHQGKHFPEAKQAFRCDACHAADPTGERQLTRGYQESCASCHDAQIEQSLAAGLPLLTLPILDTELLAETGPLDLTWPAEATGDFDGKLPVAARALLAAEPEARAALVAVGPGFDAFDVDIDSPRELADLAALMTGARRLIDELAAQGQTALHARLAALLDRPLTPQQRIDLAAGLSPDTVQGYRRRWFGDETERRLLAADDRAAQRTQVTGGGWVRDEVALALTYRPTGHADPYLRAWIELLAEASQGPQQAVIEPLFQELIRPTAPGQCGSCHQLGTDATQGSIPLWRSPVPESRHGLTFFSHRPHLVQPTLRDCESCHAIASGAGGAESGPGRPESGVSLVAASAASAFASTSTSASAVADVLRTDFAPLSKEACAACHRPQAAGARCTQCHSYHSHSPF